MKSQSAVDRFSGRPSRGERRLLRPGPCSQCAAARGDPAASVARRRQEPLQREAGASLRLVSMEDVVIVECRANRRRQGRASSGSLESALHRDESTRRAIPRRASDLRRHLLRPWRHGEPDQGAAARSLRGSNKLAHGACEPGPSVLDLGGVCAPVGHSATDTRGNGTLESPVRDDSNEAPEDRRACESDRASSVGPLGQQPPIGGALRDVLAEAATRVERKRSAESKGDARRAQGPPCSKVQTLIVGLRSRAFTIAQDPEKASARGRFAIRNLSWAN